MKRKLVLKGSYTIEASFLLPMILTVIVVITYLSMFLHDRQVLNSAAYTASLRGSQMINGENIFSEVEKCSKALINNKLLITDGIVTDIEVNSNEVSVKYNGRIELPGTAFICRYLIGGADNIAVTAQSSAKCQNAVDFIRKCRIIENHVGK